MKTLEIKKIDQEEQRAIKEKIWEDQKAKREYEKARKEAKKKASETMAQANEQERQKYEKELDELNNRLLATEE